MAQPATTPNGPKKEQHAAAKAAPGPVTKDDKPMDAQTIAQAPAAVPPTKPEEQLSDEQLYALIEAGLKLNDEVVALTARRDAVLERILANVGDKPFDFEGRRVEIRKRNYKEDDGSIDTRYYLYTPKIRSFARPKS